MVGRMRARKMEREIIQEREGRDRPEDVTNIRGTER